MTAPDRIRTAQSTATDSISAKRVETKVWFDTEWARLKSMIQQMEAEAWSDSSDRDSHVSEVPQRGDAFPRAVGEVALAKQEGALSPEEVTADLLTRLASQIEEQLRTSNSGGAL